MSSEPADPSRIAAYHAHVYYDAGSSKDRAERLRDRVAASFPAVRLGSWHDVPVGPHTQAMFQIAFAVPVFSAFVPWLMLNRDGLDVLLHPETGDDLADHADHAAWLGNRLDLRLDVLRGR